MARPRTDTTMQTVACAHQRRKRHAKQQIDEAIRRAYALLADVDDCRGAFQELLMRVQGGTDLIRATPERNRRSGACRFVDGLTNLALHHRDFIRPLSTWCPDDRGQRRLFASLVHHLLVRYPTPASMMSAWLRPVSVVAARQQAWYIAVARGQSIRRQDVPIRMTRRMEHLFLAAPDHFTIEEAMRYAQVIGLGGTRDLARAIIATRMGAHLQHDNFWETVVRFFVQAKGMRTELVNPVVDFLYHMRFAKREVIGAEGVRLLDPPQPTFTMKGRSVRSIMRRVEQWHDELARMKSDVKLSWPRSPVNGVVYLDACRDRSGERAQRIWSITELLCGATLTAEGRAMRHCVGIYSSACFKGRTSIWSMKRETEHRIQRVLTIQVDVHTRTICQARGKCNRAASRKALEFLGKWADREGLTMGTHL